MLICLVSVHHPCELLIGCLPATHGLTSPCYNSASSRFLILHHEQSFVLVIQNRLCACCGRLGHRFGCNLEIPLYSRYQRRRRILSFVFDFHHFGGFYRFNWPSFTSAVQAAKTPLILLKYCARVRSGRGSAAWAWPRVLFCCRFTAWSAAGY